MTTHSKKPQIILVLAAVLTLSMVVLLSTMDNPKLGGGGGAPKKPRQKPIGVPATLLQRAADFSTSPCPGKNFSETEDFLCPPEDPRYGPTMRPSFLRALERYVRLHRRMVDNTKAVKTRHFLVVRNPLTHGMGNRFHTILSGLLLAMVSGRALLLDWQVVSKAQATMHFNGEEKLGMAALDDLLELPPFMDVWELSKAKQRFPEILGQPSKFTRVPESQLSCYDARPGTSPSSVLDITSWDYFAPRIAANKLFSEAVAAIVSTDAGDAGLFAGLGRYLFRPSAQIASKLDRFLALRTGPTVAAHYRLIGMNKIPPSVAARFWTCVQSLVRGVGAKYGSSSKNADVSVWFAADTSRAWDHAPFALCGPCAGTPPQRVHCGAHCDTPQKDASGNATRVIINTARPAARDSPEAVIEGVTDFFLLALADDVLVSQKSIFSRSAAALAENVPQVFGPSGECFRREESQACMFLGLGTRDCQNPLPPSFAQQIVNCHGK
jgi:hypothetical protein